MRTIKSWQAWSLLSAAAAGVIVYTLAAPSLDATVTQDNLQSAATALAGATQKAAAESLAARYSSIPLHFEPNVGQSHEAVKYLAKGIGYQLLLTANEAIIHLAPNTKPAANATESAAPAQSTVLRAQIVGANTKAKVLGEDEQKGKSNYFIGNAPDKWRTNVANYSKVRYQDIYPGIDLVYYGNQGSLEYDFIVQPGADPKKIHLSYDGAESLHIDAAGNLIAKTPAGNIIQKKPIIYQAIAGQKKMVDGHFSIAKNNVSFDLGEYDPHHELVIDPVLTYSTLLGGGAYFENNISDIVVDDSGSFYVTGRTDMSTFPLKAPYQSTGVGTKAFITKFAADGKSLIFSTYLGGNDKTAPVDLALDHDKNLYIGGQTLATNFPTANAFQENSTNASGNAFLTKLAADGQSLIFSTYLSGSASRGPDTIYSIAVAPDNSAYVGGQTSSTFPVKNAFQASRPGPYNSTTGFASHFSADGKTLLFSTYFGGSGADAVASIALDSSNNLYLFGGTTSAGFPVKNAIQPALNRLDTDTSVNSDLYIAKLSGDGQNLIYSTYLGGTGNEYPGGIAVDGAGNAYVVGSTSRADFPVKNAWQATASVTYNNATAGIFFKISPSGSLDFSSYFGNYASISSVALDSSGAIILGGSAGPNFPILHPIANVTNDASSNSYNSAFLSKFSGDGQTLVFSTLIGTNNPLNNSVSSISVDGDDNFYVAGNTFGATIPMLDAFQGTASGSSGFIAKISAGPFVHMTVTPSTIRPNESATLSWSSDAATNCISETWGTEPLSGSRTVTPASVGQYRYKLRCENAEGKTTQYAVLNVGEPPSITLSLPEAITAYQTTTLSWSAAHASTCTASSPYYAFNGPKPTSGSILVGTSFPALPAQIVFTLTCDGPGGTSTETRTMRVVSPPTASVSLIGSGEVGKAFKIVWSSTNASSCSGSGLLNGPLATSGSEDYTPSSGGVLTQAITCTSVNSSYATTSTSITVYPLPLPSLSISGSPSSLTLGESTTLSWSSDGSSCFASGAWTGSKAPTGTAAVTPASTGLKTYSLSCTGPGGTTSKEVSINVAPPLPSVELSITPGTITLGETVQVSWSSTYASSCSANGSGWSGSVAVSGTQPATLTATGHQTLTLTCSNATGDTSATANVTVNPASTPSTGGTGSSSGGGGGGGPLELPVLFGLALLGLLSKRLHKNDV